MELLFGKTAPSKQELGFNSEEKSRPVESNQYVSLSNSEFDKKITIHE